DHDHYNGRYRQAICTACNLNLKEPNFIPIIFHNLEGYDSHPIISELTNINIKNIELIPKNSERFLTFTLKRYKKGSEGKIYHLKFIDSLAFMNSSLDSLAKNLLDDK